MKCYCFYKVDESRQQDYLSDFLQLIFMQPIKRSLEHYVSRGHYFSTGKDLPNELRCYDEGILIIDDIIDNSELRNNNKTKSNN